LHHRLALGLLTAVSASAALGQPAAPIARGQFLTVMDQEFRKMDADKDGKLSPAEVEAFQRATAVAEAAQRNRALFARLDADRNGQLSPAEFLKVNAPAAIDPRPVFAQYDPNRDGIITLVEHRTVKLSRFDAIDADKDGVASIAEQRAAGLIK
jgi:hypothetical protein